MLATCERLQRANAARSRWVKPACLRQARRSAASTVGPVGWLKIVVVMVNNRMSPENGLPETRLEVGKPRLILHRRRPNPNGPIIRELWLQDQLDGSCVGNYRLEVQGGRPVVAETRIVPQDGEAKLDRDGQPVTAPTPPGGVRAGLARSAARTQAVLTVVRDRLEAFVDQVNREAGGTAAELELAEFGLALEAACDVVRRPQRTSDSSLAELARDYVDECERNPRSPRKTLAARKMISESHCSKLLSQARDRGLLTSGGRGRSGGELTARAKQLLGI
jgi:hypothetical protein